MASPPPQPAPGQLLPPPRLEVGVIGWMRGNLFSTWYNILLTVVSAAIIVLALIYGLRWAITGADWTVIRVLGGQMVIGQYNTEGACPGQNCFWRPQVALLLATVLLGMGWGLAGGGTAKRMAIGVVAILTLFAFLPYSFERMGMDVRLLLAANIPALLIGWAVVRYGRMKAQDVVVTTISFFLLTLFLLRGNLAISSLQPALPTVMILLMAAAVTLGMGCGLIDDGPNRILGSRITTRILRIGGALIPGILLSFLLSVWPLGLAFLLIVLLFLAGVALVRFTGMSVRGCIVSVVIIFAIVLLFLRGMPGVPGLQPVLVIYWGGLTLNLLLSVVGIGLSLPIGIGLALGRRSNLPVVKLFCVVFIEVFRGVPLITLLFMSQHLVPLAFPENFPTNSLLRASIVITLFSSAYMAENIRGGLQALHPGQAEAARALGLPGRQTTLLISLPQAIRNVIPAIVGQFISLFKDTSLVYIIGMLDVVEISRAFIQGNAEYLVSAKEVFVVLALVFWVFTYPMSYVSGKVEEHLGVGQR